MPAFRTGRVTRLLSERRGLQRVEVDGEPSYVLTALVGTVAEGDRVVINTTAVDRGLGTGGWHFVHWNLEREDLRTETDGHIMKLRYTSLQADTGVLEEHHSLPETIPGTPVVALALHSQLGPVCAAVKELGPTARVVYVMTDAGALPIALSDLVADLQHAGLLDATITAGHAFGGDAEAVNVRSALSIAKHHLGADVIVVGMGPGSVGTSTGLGYSGLEVGTTLDAIAAAGGEPIVALRVSNADLRPRHQGVSAHSRTALSEASHVRVAAPVPVGAAGVGDLGEQVAIVEIVPPDAVAALQAAGITPTTMGRSAEQDPALFTFAAAAGAYAAGRAFTPPQ